VAFNYTLRQPRGIAGLISRGSPSLFVELEDRAAIAVGTLPSPKAERTDADDGLHAVRDCARSRSAEGCLNVVHGTGPNVGAAITAHPKINTILVHRWHGHRSQVAEACAPLFKKVSLELGGKIQILFC